MSEGEYEKQVKRLFVILDRFKRDAIYRQCYVELNFKELSNIFVDILSEILNDNTERQLSYLEHKLDDYQDQLNFIGDIKPIYIDELRKNLSKSSKMRCTLLFLAVSKPTPKDETERSCLQKIIIHLIRNCPHMVLFPMKSADASNEGATVEERNGPTPLHVMVVKEANSTIDKNYKYSILKEMLGTHVLDTGKQGIDLKNFNIKGEMSKGRIMRGKTILNIAARTLDIKTIKILLSSGVCFDSFNEYKDNMYHSLIRYAVLNPEKEAQIKSTIQNIADFLEERTDISSCILKKKSKRITSKTFLERDSLKYGFDSKPVHSIISVKAFDPAKQDAPERLWGMKNREGLTPLQLAAKKGRFELFEFILNLKVYRLNDKDKGSFDDDVYDITEIDSIPVKHGEDSNRKEAKTENVREKLEKHVSVLHLLVQQSSIELTTRFVSIAVISRTISEKWNSYKKWFCIWAVMHFLIMCLYSWEAVVRSNLDNPILSSNSNSSAYETIPFVVVSSSITAFYGVLCVLSQISFYVRYGFMLRRTLLFHSYGHGFMLLGLCIIVDYISMLTSSTYENFVLPFAIIIGWYLIIYFLHVIERFSFFTVLIKSVLGDLLQFVVVFGALLVGFSVAMFVVMQKATESDEDAFEDIRKTFVKMFTVMVGMGEIGILFNARHPPLAITIFVLFVIMTTLLLLNALIAIMSNTCSNLTVSVSSKVYVQLQRMYTIIHFEAMFPYNMCSPAALAISSTRPGTGPRRFLSLRLDEDHAEEDAADGEDNMQDTMMAHVAKSIISYISDEKASKERPKPKTTVFPAVEKIQEKEQEMSKGVQQRKVIEIYENY